MSLPNGSVKQETLRTQAEVRLKEGTAPRTYGWLPSLDALALLHKLASAPESAGDALKLLHELQVHQVELDLQHEQLEASERERSEDLLRRARLYDLAPVGYFVVDHNGGITSVNRAGAHLFGADLAELEGRRIDSLLAPASRPILASLLAQLRDGGANATCEVRSGSGASMQLVASVATGEPSYLLVLVEKAV